MKSLALLLATVAVAATPALANQSSPRSTRAPPATHRQEDGRPAYKEVAAKYRGKADAEACWSTKVKKADRALGPGADAPHAAVSDADVKPWSGPGDQ